MSDDYHGLPTPRTTLRDKRRRRRTTAAALAGLLTALPAVSSARDVAILAPPPGLKSGRTTTASPT
jgi:hypothetical protein